MLLGIGRRNFHAFTVQQKIIELSTLEYTHIFFFLNKTHSGICYQALGVVISLSKWEQCCQVAITECSSNVTQQKVLEFVRDIRSLWCCQSGPLVFALHLILMYIYFRIWFRMIFSYELCYDENFREFMLTYYIVQLEIWKVFIANFWYNYQWWTCLPR